MRTEKPFNEKEDKKNEPGAIKERIYIGIYPGFSWSNYASSYEISPLIGFDIIPRLSIGLGIVYKRSSSKGYYTNLGVVDPYKASIYGGRGFASFTVYQNFSAYAEYEGVTIDLKSDYYSNFKIWRPSLNAGVLYKSEMGEKFGINFLVLYNLLYKEDAQFRESPLDIRIGLVFYPFR